MIMEFLFITVFVGLIGFLLLTSIFICMNRKEFSKNLPKQIKIYRWIYACGSALTWAGVATFIVRQFFHPSDQNLYIIWAVLFILLFAGIYMYVKSTIKEWFIPNQKLPKLPIRFIPKNKKNLLLIIIFFILIAILFIGPLLY